MKRHLTTARLIAAALLWAATSATAGAASLDGIELHSTSAGAGPTIIFVHGWTCDTSSWREQLPALTDRYRVIALDLPGHGMSESPAPEKFSIELFARAVEAVRAEAGAETIVLVGHSMGAPVIRQYALMWPEHVAGLVAVDGPLDLRNFGGGNPGQPPQVTLEMRENMIRGMFVPQTPEPLREHILEMMLGAPAATAQGAMSAMFDPSLREARVITAPAISIVAGTADVPDVAAAADVLPHYDAMQIAGTGHFLMMEAPEAFNRALEDFLMRIGY